MEPYLQTLIVVFPHNSPKRKTHEKKLNELVLVKETVSHRLQSYTVRFGIIMTSLHTRYILQVVFERTLVQIVIAVLLLICADFISSCTVFVFVFVPFCLPMRRVNLVHICKITDLSTHICTRVVCSRYGWLQALNKISPWTESKFQSWIPWVTKPFLYWH